MGAGKYMAQNIVATITVQMPDGQKKSISLKDGESVRLGRLETSDLQLNDPSVSRAHVMFSASTSGVVVSDLKSTNGTFVNGKRIDIPVDLQKGDVVDVGSFKINVELLAGEIDASVAMAGRTMTAQLRPSTAMVIVLKLKASCSAEEVPETYIKEQKAEWAKLISKTVSESSGKIDKILDDSIVAIWYGMDGKKIAAEVMAAAERLVTVTRQMSLNPRWERYHATSPWDCMVAVNAGMALTGSVGGKEGIKNFAVLGDTINVAFRVAGAGNGLAARFLISDSVLQHWQSANVSKVATLESSGTNDSITIYAVGS